MPVFDEAAIIFLGLARLKGIGFKTLRDLGGVDAIARRALSEGPDFVETLTKGSANDCRLDNILALGKSAAEVLTKVGIGLVRFGEDRFPVQFAELESSARPLWFFYQGNYDLLANDAVAVVGTRSPSPVGEFLTKYAVAAAQEAGVTVVSGLAKGVDEIAHEWALECGVPNISVLGTGLLRPYPAKNTLLSRRIIEAGGLLISEYMPDASPSAENFVWRNRLQAALAKCVIAPEWKRSSGTAHTIRFAKRFSRPSINLTLNGVSPPPDHGVADDTYEVPHDHAALIHALLKVDSRTEARILNMQESLF